DCTGLINVGNSQDGVVLRVIIPRCWNGLSPSVPANYAYPNFGLGPSCPAAFPKVLPVVNIRFHTGIVNPCAGELTLFGQAVSCPPGSKVPPAFGFENADGTMMPWYDAHGDFMDGWQPGEGGLTDLEQDCLKAVLPCPVNPHTSPASNMPT